MRRNPILSPEQVLRIRQKAAPGRPVPSSPDGEWVAPPGAALIPLKGGGFAIVDSDVPDDVMARRWVARNADGRHYAVTGQFKIAMHRLLVGASPGQYVDHINGNTLDNRLSNLRICTNAENIRNSRKYQKAGVTSRLKGVCVCPRGWRAQIMHGGKKYNLGTFGTEFEAARAYDEAARRLFGEFARCNFPADQG